MALGITVTNEPATGYTLTCTTASNIQVTHTIATLLIAQQMFGILAANLIMQGRFVNVVLQDSAGNIIESIMR